VSSPPPQATRDARTGIAARCRRRIRRAYPISRNAREGDNRAAVPPPPRSRNGDENQNV
jgi:hypothetical protein